VLLHVQELAEHERLVDEPEGERALGVAKGVERQDPKSDLDAPEERGGNEDPERELPKDRLDLGRPG
jgi:hypothetical protein